MRGVTVAGTRSSAGKTTVALGLMAGLARRGLAVQPFKVGPDFIDPGRHELAAGRPAHNLDTWMCPPSAVREIAARGMAEGGGADIAVIEGVMGLYDGAAGDSDQGSTAEVAALLGAPVLLVVDGASMGRSVAAQALGYVSFGQQLAWAGVLVNNVASERHARIVSEAMACLPEIPFLGCLARNPALHVPSRHLGLVTAEDAPLAPEDLARLADWLEQGLEVSGGLDGLLARLPELELDADLPPDSEPPVRTRIAVARDAAFCFYYRENLRLLRQAGAELAFFSPLTDRRLPEDVAGLYLGGGYPELHARELSGNVAMRREIARFAASGRPVYAECGGFMYLMADLLAGRQRFPMAGVLDLRAAMGERFAALGYREVCFARDTPLGPEGSLARGHEFHYSQLEEPPGDGLAPAYEVRDRLGPRPAEGWLAGNTLASYIHLHFASNPGLAPAFVDACAAKG